MKRKRPEDRSKSYRARRTVRLYLEDVEDLLTIAQSADPTARGETEDYGDIAHASELVETGLSELRDFEIRGASIHISAGRPVSVSIVNREDNDLLAAFSRARDLLQTRQDNLGVAVQFGAIVLSGAVLAILNLTLLRPGHKPLPAYLAVLLGVLGFSLGFASAYLRRVVDRRRGTVIPKPRSEAPTLWEQHRAAILISLATNVFVAGLFFLLGLLVGSG